MAFSSMASPLLSQEGLPKAGVAAAPQRWSDVELATIDMWAIQYREHACELRRAIGAIVPLIKGDDAPSDLALIMRKRVLEEIYRDVIEKQELLQTTAARKRQAAAANNVCRH
eukprot:TRINITY_DN35082_c0_g1_i1.p2 TRINITY_DN35082_c0_g1~~TRINITY_DN35082_c0_g1_i1.p2  ORF type:complete len:113 (-),score=19.98 TRINITY_DN35082_c0_g1_i1:143-481(-)